jgi:hypothetical protein
LTSCFSKVCKVEDIPIGLTCVHEELIWRWRWTAAALERLRRGGSVVGFWLLN